MKILIILSAVAVGVSGSPAAEPFFQASLAPDIAINSKTAQIDGICLSIWGENPQRAFALGFVNGSTGDSVGFTLGLVNYAENYTGVAWGLVNISHKKFVGWQSGAVCYSEGYFKGFQTGWINVSQEFHGLQWGLVNYAENLRGVQIGFVNVARNNPWFKEFPDKLAAGFPIVNWSF
ncbi:MAG: hypothetical protein WCH99_16135 [Verrucomicrobiota bacterium]